ncbi:MAG TPA: ATP-dependent DNA helicase RecQ [Paludibacteraceae bacterium]|mgnify:CR=1 FL=1|nr:ATP-dependent DNA helicase RecQ [Paludibacteraceae bacterium]
MSASTSNPTHTAYHDILKEYWGYDDFRPLQLDIIESIGSGRDTLGLMPTGGGKSITFQVPALAMEGICIVVTPLIALMKDQVENLKQRGIKATAIYSGMAQHEILAAFDNCELGDYKFLYVSPERLATDLFKTRLKHLTVSMIAVDESHCISQWGYDFRPSYLQIAEIRQLLPNVPVLALTATATPDVVDDIQERLKFPQKNLFQKSFERKNLVYVVRYVEDKLEQLVHILHRVPGTSVVYVRSRKKTKEIAEFLVQQNISADYFHAGLADEQKDYKQQAWKSGECRVIVATNAFGMGIDKPDVRTVIHLDLPDTLEAYFQEAGRAGRDEQRAYAILLYNKTDETKLKKRISDTFPDKERIKTTYQALADYFEIGVGSAFQAVYPFNLQLFCTTCHLPINPTYNALKILELAGYLELTEEVDNPSKLMFTVKREELYQFRTKNPALDELIEVILRSYTGVFTDMIHINEELIGKRLGRSRQTIYEQLMTLDKNHIVTYVPFKKTPFLIYTRSREDSSKLVIPKEAYEERRERYVNRIASVLAYANEKEVCRSRVLLNYFGEKHTLPCGQCDICLAHKARAMKEARFVQLEEQIVTLLTETPLSITQLMKQLQAPEEEVLQVIRHLLDHQKLTQTSTMKLAVK